MSDGDFAFWTIQYLLFVIALGCIKNGVEDNEDIVVATWLILVGATALYFRYVIFS